MDTTVETVLLPMSILMISPQYRPIVGGYERAAERLSGALSRQGLKVVVITERRDRTWSAAESIDGYEIRRLPCIYRRHFHALTSLFVFGCYLLWRGRSFAIWHVHQYGPHAALAVALGKLLNRPVVLKLTSSCEMGIEVAMGNGLMGWLFAALHQRVDACFAVSEETREEAINFGIPGHRVHLIPNGVDGRQFYEVSLEERIAARLSLGLGCERLVLWMGRLMPEKNPLGMLDAWAAINSKLREGALLVLVGDGPEWDKVNTRVQELGLVNGVHLAGLQNDVVTWYKAADVYGMSSNREGLSNSMLEALASGLPVISTRVSGSSILLESPASGLVVDGMKQFTGAMESLLNDEALRAQFGRNARQIFERRFSLDSIATRVISIYMQLLGNA